MLRMLSRKEKQFLIFGLIGVIVLITAFIILYFQTVKKIEGTYEEKLQKAEEQINLNKKMVYVAKEKIIAGDVISLENVALLETFSSIPTINCIVKDDIGKIAAVDIEPDVHILKNMIVDSILDSDLREEEYHLFTLNSNLKENDFVDIRIMYPNGENYIVLSKKMVKNLQLENNQCFLWLNEEEILTLSSAIVDAYLHDGTKLYTSKYIQPLLQEESYVTYIPNLSVMRLMEVDKNILNLAIEKLNEQARIELEERLTLFQDKNSEVNYSGDNYFTEDMWNNENSTSSVYPDYSNDELHDEGDEEFVE